MGKSITELYRKFVLHMCDNSGDAKFDSAIQIVIAFVIGAVLLTVLGSVFSGTIKGWLESSAGSWFKSGGNTIPSVTP